MSDRGPPKEALDAMLREMEERMQELRAVVQLAAPAAPQEAAAAVPQAEAAAEQAPLQEQAAAAAAAEQGQSQEQKAAAEKSERLLGSSTERDGASRSDGESQEAQQADKAAAAAAAAGGGSLLRSRDDHPRGDGQDRRGRSGSRAGRGRRERSRQGEGRGRSRDGRGDDDKGRGGCGRGRERSRDGRGKSDRDRNGDKRGRDDRWMELGDGYNAAVIRMDRVLEDVRRAKRLRELDVSQVFTLGRMLGQAGLGLRDWASSHAMRELIVALEPLLDVERRLSKKARVHADWM